MNTVAAQSTEPLLILAEEAAEVVQAVSKCIRFGISGVKPGTTQTNGSHLQQELGDLLAMIDILVSQGIINDTDLLLAKISKKEKLRQWSTIDPELLNK